jgi:predicted metal-dependent hydrolase
MISGRMAFACRSSSPPKLRSAFDESLLSKSRQLQDYVIVHEPLHVSVPNHGSQ